MTVSKAVPSSRTPDTPMPLGQPLHPHIDPVPRQVQLPSSKIRRQPVTTSSLRIWRVLDKSTKLCSRMANNNMASTLLCARLLGLHS